MGTIIYESFIFSPENINRVSFEIKLISFISDNENKILNCVQITEYLLSRQTCIVGRPVENRLLRLNDSFFNVPTPDRHFPQNGSQTGLIATNPLFNTVYTLDHD